MRAAPTDLFSKISTGRASEDVVRQIRGAMDRRELSPGDRLPPERELAEQFGISRVTVRDALRVLETEGLVAIRVGAHGGAYVTAPEPDHVSHGLANLLMMSQVTADEMTEARMIFELGVIHFVCERATEEDIAALTEICDRSEASLASGVFDVSLSAEFHTRLASSAHNLAVAMVTEAFQEPILRSLVRAKTIDPHMGDPGVHEHRAIVTAIAQHDAATARTIMGAHLERTQARLRADRQAR